MDGMNQGGRSRERVSESDRQTTQVCKGHLHVALHYWDSRKSKRTSHILIRQWIEDQSTYIYIHCQPVSIECRLLRWGRTNNVYGRAHQFMTPGKSTPRRTSKSRASIRWLQQRHVSHQILPHLRHSRGKAKSNQENEVNIHISPQSATNEGRLHG